MVSGQIRASPRAALLITLTFAAIASGGQAAPGQSPTRVACPGTFGVLHNDRVGGLRLAAGAYQITVANPARLTCARAAANFAEFLRDYDGKVRTPWTVNAQLATFQRGTDPAIAFSLARVGSAGGGGGTGNPTANACPGFFRVSNNDHIGTLSLSKGPYRLTLLNPKTLSCTSAARRFSGFLRDYDGRLVRPWVLDNSTGTFTRGKGSTTGFRVKAAVGPEPKPNSGGRSPAKGQPGECRGAFRVLNRDRIDRLSLPAGRYLTFVAKGSGLTCAELSRLLRGFLARRDTPRGYSVDAATGTFLNRGRPIFRIKPASPRGIGQPAAR